MTPVIFSADDFSYHAGVDEAVLDLATRGRLTATACMTAAPGWQAAARQFTPALRQQLDIGLHLDFTEFDQGQPLSTLIVRSHLGQLDPGWIQTRIARQLDAFEDAMGTPPDYVDGHQHVHQLPQIRTELLRQLRQRYAAPGPWLRGARPLGGGLKGLVIRALGSGPLLRRAKHLQFNCSGHLLGSYGFDLDAQAYGQRLHSWLSAADPLDALMVHPGASAPAFDPIGRARMIEYQVLSSDLLPELLDKLQVRPVRGRELHHHAAARQLVQ